MDHIRERLLKKGVSKTAAQLIIGTSSQLSYYRPGECGLAGVINDRLMHFGMIRLLDYLAFLFEKGYGYRTTGCHRSAISTFHDYVGGKPVGQHPDVCARVSGIYNNRPPQPRVESVINRIKTKWKNNENWSEKYLIYKLGISMT